ncbi:MAG: hypothetical protein HGB17_15300 [Syntrophobacteraceae bacterium]|nr:hypothetical protein [Syntrophobacteraceae bacterium]
MEILLERKDASEQPHTLAGAPLAAVDQKKDRTHFSWFWNLYPNRTNVKAAETTLSALDEKGIDREEIESGLVRFRLYCDVTGNIRMARMSAVNWLEAEKWRDGWELPLKKQTAKKPSRAKLNELRERFEDARAVDKPLEQYRALRKLVDDIETEVLFPHIWGKDSIPDNPWSKESKSTALCLDCWNYLHGADEEDTSCDLMAETFKLSQEAAEFLGAEIALSESEWADLDRGAEHDQ